MRLTSPMVHLSKTILKEPYEMSMAWEPDRRSNFFFSPPAHLCAVAYMTEILLIVTLNNQFTYRAIIYAFFQQTRPNDGNVVQFCKQPVPNLTHLFSHVNHTSFNPEIFTCFTRILTCKLD